MVGIYAPTPVPAGCLDTATIDTWLQNTKALADCVAEVRGGVTCAPINGAIVDGCIVIDSGRSAVNPSSAEATALDKKLTLGYVTINVDNQTVTTEQSDGPQTQVVAGVGTFRAVLYCDGVAVASTAAATIQSTGMLALNMSGCCPRNASVQVCLEQIGPTQLTYSASVCGALLCLQENYLLPLAEAMPSYCCPPFFIPAGCNVGRAGLHLLRQNLAAIHAVAAAGVNTVECPAAASFAGAGSQTLYTFDQDCAYLVVGSAVVCVESFSNDAITFTGGPSVSCGGQQTYCPLRRILPEQISTDATGLREACWNFPVVACGVCKEGDTIVAGMESPEGVCEDNIDPNITSQIAGGNIVSIDQQYTVYTFCTTDPIAAGELAPWIEPRLLKCPERLQVELLIAQADALNGYLSGLGNNLNYCNEITSGGGGPLPLPTFTDIIRPPFPPPPTGPVPNKKTMVFGFVDICLDNTSLNSYGQFDLDITITCGGDVLNLSQIGALQPENLPSLSDNQVQQGITSVCFSQPVQYTFNCLTTDPVIATVTLNGDPWVEGTVKYNFLAFCA